MDRDDDNPLDMNLQDLIGKNTTPDGWENPSENRLCFPYTNSYLEVEYEKPEGSEIEAWTCYLVMAGDKTQTHWPICAYIKS